MQNDRTVLPGGYLTCPVCKRRIVEPFSRYCGPIPYVHRTRGHDNGERGCRLIVWPDPTGNHHRIWQVPAGTSLETALHLILTTRKGVGLGRVED